LIVCNNAKDEGTYDLADCRHVAVDGYPVISAGDDVIISTFEQQ